MKTIKTKLRSVVAILIIIVCLMFALPASASETYTVFLPSGSGYEANVINGYSAINLAPGAEVRFTLTLKDGYTQSVPQVSVNGEAVTEDNGIYIISDIREDKNVAVSGVTKNTYSAALPSGTGYAVVAAPGYNAQSIPHGSAFKFTVALLMGYTDSQPVVKLSGNLLTPDFNGTYTVAGVVSDISGITVENILGNHYTITFKNSDGSVLLSTFASYGEAPLYTGETPSQASTAQYEYAFADWYPSLHPVTGDAVYTARYSESTRNYTVRFVNYDNILIEDYSVPFGGAAACTVTPTREPEADGYAYGFIGWSRDTSVVTSDITATARYEHVHTYRILTFPATCTEPGYSMKMCTACHYNLTYDYVSAAGHTYGEWTVVTPATETEEGQRSCTCTVCGDIQYETIPAGTPPETTEPDAPDEPDEPQEDNSIFAKIKAFFDKILAFIKSMFIR